MDNIIYRKYGFITESSDDLEEFQWFKPFKEMSSSAWFTDETGYPGNYRWKEIKEAQRIILEFCIEMTR